MLQLPHGNNLHTTKKRLQLHNNIMRAYIEPPEEPTLYTYKNTNPSISLQIEGSKYIYHLPSREFPYTIEYDDEELGTINFIPYNPL